eukprot:g42900.t1
MLQISSFYHKYIKKASPYGQAIRIHRICSEEEEHDRHLKVLRNALLRTGYDAQLIDCQFQRATVKNCNNLFRRQTWYTTNRVPFVVQYFPGVEKLHHVLRSLQHIIYDNEHLIKIFPTQGRLGHGILEKQRRHYNNERVDTAQQSPDKGVPSHWGSTSAVKGIRPWIF